MNGKMILGITAAAVTVLLAFALYNGSRLQTIDLRNSIQIEASQDHVYQMISQLNNYPKWSPFLAQDPSQQYSIAGADGTVGARYLWNGNKGKDVGYQEIVLLEPNNRVVFQCNIQEPFKAQPGFDYTITSTGNNVNVNQKFKLESGLIDAVFLWIFNVKPEMQATNQQGLALLKAACEK